MKSSALLMTFLSFLTLPAMASAEDLQLPACAEQNLGVLESNYYDSPVNQTIKTWFDPARQTMNFWDERGNNRSYELDFRRFELRSFRWSTYWSNPHVSFAISCSVSPDFCLQALNGLEQYSSVYAIPRGGLIQSLQSAKTNAYSESSRERSHIQQQLSCAIDAVEKFGQKARALVISKKVTLSKDETEKKDQ